MTEFTRNGDILGEGTYGKVFTVNIRDRPEPGALKEMYYENTISGFGNIREIEILSKLSRNSNFIPKVLFVHIDNYTFKPLNMTEEKRTEFVSVVCEVAECDGSKFFAQRTYTIHTALKLISQLLMAISHLHNKDIYHRDIKPGNILIYRDKNGEPILKLSDFGFSNWNSNTCRKSPKINTPWYRAPEVAWKVRNYKMSTDIWSAGCTIYEILTGDILMRKVGNSEDPVAYFEHCLRVIPNEWTEDMQRTYRKYSDIHDAKNLKVFGSEKIRPIRTAVNDFMGKFRTCKRYRQEDNALWLIANNILVNCFNFDYRARKNAEQILSENHFDSLREYIEDELKFQKRDIYADSIRVEIPEELNRVKCEYFREAYQVLRNKVKLRVFFHAVDLTNVFLTTFPDTKHNVNDICAASMYYFEKFFSILTYPEMPHEFFFRSYTKEQLETEDVFREIDKFIYNFEKLVINKSKLIGLKTYRDVPYEIQDIYNHYLTESQLEELFYEFCSINHWNGRKSYRYMYRYLYNKLFDNTFPVDL